MGTSPEIDQLTIDEIFGDVNLNTAQQLYVEYRKNPEGNFADILLEEIISDSIDLINFRTNQQNDPMFMAYLLEWSVRGFDLTNRVQDGTPIPYLEVIDFVHLDHAVNNPEDDVDYEVLSNTWTKEIYDEAFSNAIEQFGA